MNETAQRTLAIVAPYFPPLGGGLEKYAFEIATRLEKEHNWRVIVITSSARNGTDEKQSMQGLTVYRLGYEFKVSNTPFSFSWFGKIGKILKEENPDVINVHMPVPGIGDVAALMAGKRPVVVTYHAGSMKKSDLSPHSKINMLIALYENGPLALLLQRANHIICSSNSVRVTFLKDYLYKTSTITPAVDASLFVPVPEKKAARPTILFVAGLGAAEQHKGLLALIEAVDLLRVEIPDVELVIVGQGDMREQYELRVKMHSLEDNVSFMGRLTGQALAEQYQRAHVFALPSTNESFGMTIIEAMASGLPVVASSIGDIPTIIDNGETGFLIPPGSVTDLKDKLQEILQHPDIINSFGQAGHAKVVQGFNWNDRAQSYDEIFSKISTGRTSERAKKIVFVAPYFFPYTGGLENYVLNIAKGLRATGEWDVVVITSHFKGVSKGVSIMDGIKIYRLPTMLKLSNTPVNPFWYFGINKILQQENPDIINAHTPVPFISDVAESVRKKIPFVLTYHNDLVKKDRLGSFLARIAYLFLMNRTIRHADRIIVTSNTYAKKSPYLKDYLYKVRVVSPGVDLTMFNEQVDKTWLKEKYGTTFAIMFVGQLSKTHTHKGVDVLMDSVKLLDAPKDSVRLIIVGSGDAIDGYKKYAKDIGLTNVIFTGYVDESELPKYYAGADVVVLPSTTSAEGFGMVLLEAMACGTAVIGSDIGGIPEVIHDGVDGTIVSPKDPQALAQAIHHLLDSKEVAMRMGKEGSKKIETNFSWVVKASETSEIFSDLRHE